jgi:SAM-dependent methyltransferase
VAQSAPASFRDPSGRLFRTSDLLVRIVNPAGIEDFRAFQASQTAERFAAAGRLVGARPLTPDELTRLQTNPELAGPLARAAAAIAHERVWFPSFPYEWPPEMLHAAGRLTLDLARAAAAEGLGLKDATPFNVLFRGPSPVFVDWLSVERRASGDEMWLAYAQFVRTFVLPLLAFREFGLTPSHVFLARRDGLEPEEVYRMAGLARRLTPSLLAHATLPTWLSGGAGGAQPPSGSSRRRGGDPARARFVLEALFRRLGRTLDRLDPPARESRWTAYMAEQQHYSRDHFGRKEAFVREAFAALAPRRVLDLGCNTGHFSLLAARAGAAVVAVDGDPAVVGRLWRRASADRLDVQPLVANIARPSPPTGWRNRECASLLERATGAFDAVLMLAVLHHILVSERVPLEDVLELVADLTRDALVIEFVGPDDPMFRLIARGRDHLHRDLTMSAFEAACAHRFTVEGREALDGSSRVLYLLRRRT